MAQTKIQSIRTIHLNVSKIMEVFILLFNAGTDNEGIYAMKINAPEADGGDPQDVVLAFEEEDDATRYALYLEAQDFQTATVEPISHQELEAICQSSGYELQLIPAGLLAVPPEATVAQTDWQAENSPSQTDPTPAEYAELDQIRLRLEKLLE